MSLVAWMVDRIYKDNRWVLSRRAPAMLGFPLAALGPVISVYRHSPLTAVISFSLALFGADMTLPPSWALCNRDAGRAKTIMDKFGIARHYTDYRAMLEKERPDFVDVITPPPPHLEMSRIAADLGVHVICQKPLAPTFEEARQIVDYTNRAGVRFMVHENWRFQPWYREIRRLLVYENGVHFIDTYRYLGGEIAGVYAVLKKLNPVIAGEDFGVVVFNFVSGVTGLWDANRYNESNYPKPHYTFDEFLVDGNGGSIRLYNDARLTIQKLGHPEKEHHYPREDRNFCGDCCYATQRHFIDRLLDGKPFETSGPDYLRTLAVQDAVYESAAPRIPLDVHYL